MNAKVYLQDPKTNEVYHYEAERVALRDGWITFQRVGDDHVVAYPAHVVHAVEFAPNQGFAILANSFQTL